MLIPHQRPSGQSIDLIFKGQEIQMQEHCTTEVNIVLFLGLCPLSNFLRSTMFWKLTVVLFNQAKKYLTWLTL